MYLNLSKINVGLVFSSGEMGGAEKEFNKMAQSDEIIDYKIYLFGKTGPFCRLLKVLNSYFYSFGSNYQYFLFIKINLYFEKFKFGYCLCFWIERYH